MARDENVDEDEGEHDTGMRKILNMEMDLKMTTGKKKQGLGLK